jgi:hypothetical protein
VFPTITNITAALGKAQTQPGSKEEVMPEEFEMTGTVSAVEQKRYREGGGLIPGFWNVKLQTSEGERSVSFNSERRINPGERNSPTEPHPDFALIQGALASGQAIRIRGRLTRKGEGEDARTFKNGMSAELVAPTEGAPVRSPDSATSEPEMENAKWAVGTVLPQLNIEGTMSENDLTHVKQEAGKLLDATEEVADQPSNEEGNATEPTELERRREERRKRKGLG